MRKMNTLIIMSIIIYILGSPVMGIDNKSVEKHVTYKVLIDQNYGFFRAFEMYDKLLGKEINQQIEH